MLEYCQVWVYVFLLSPSACVVRVSFCPSLWRWLRAIPLPSAVLSAPRVRATVGSPCFFESPRRWEGFFGALLLFPLHQRMASALATPCGRRLFSSFSLRGSRGSDAVSLSASAAASSSFFFVVRVGPASILVRHRLRLLRRWGVASATVVPVSTPCPCRRGALFLPVGFPPSVLARRVRFLLIPQGSLPLRLPRELAVPPPSWSATILFLSKTFRSSWAVLP